MSTPPPSPVTPAISPDLDYDLADLLMRGAAVGPPYPDLSPSEGRKQFAVVAELRQGDYQPPVSRVVEENAHGVPVRVYWPEPGHATPALIVLFHGGGWVLGDLDSYDVQARLLCSAVGSIVVSVDYRLAPEHPFPNAFDDCYCTTVWAHERAPDFGGDPARFSVAGDSAGGNLAAAVCLRARDEGGPPIAAQCLIYPALDLRLTAPSYRELATGYGLTTELMHWYVGNYLPDPEDAAKNPFVSPSLAPDLAGLPPAVVATAYFDPLRDEGDSFAERLAEAGVKVHHHQVADLVHGFFGMTSLPKARAAAEAICVSFRGLLDEH